MSAAIRFSSSPLNGATSTLWLRANCISCAASAFASCSVENIAVTWRASSLPNTTDSIRARQTRSVIASVRTTLFSVFMRLVKLLPVPMREVCQLPTISTQVRIDSKLKRPQRRADAWKQNAATKARIADVPTSEKRFCCQGAPTSKLRTKTSVMPIAASTSTVA